MRHWEDLAWRMQDDTENVLLARARWLRETTGAKNLCMAGGVALNCVANGRVAREAGFDNVWIQPAAGDDGIAIGCAYYGWLEILKQRRGFVMEHSYVGKPYTDQDVATAAAEISGAHPGRGQAQRQYLPRHRKAARRSAGDRLVSGPLRVRPARARQPQPARRSAQARDEGHPEQPRQAPAGVPAVRADRAGRAHEGDFRRRRGFAVHADRQAGPARMARQDSGDRACRRHRARPDRARSDQSDAVSVAEGVRGADRRSRADQHLIQHQGRADRGNAAGCGELLPDHGDRSSGDARHGGVEDRHAQGGRAAGQRVRRRANLVASTAQPA